MGLIGRRYTAAMPSRPVLIGRGLVPHPHTNKNRVSQRSNENVSRPLPNTKQPCVEPPQLNTRHNSTHTESTPTQRRPTWVTRVTAAIATGKHPDPSRTRKLSLPAPMVLPPRGGGRVGRRRTSFPAEATRAVASAALRGQTVSTSNSTNPTAQRPTTPEKVTTRGRPATRPASRPWIRQQ